MSKQVCPCHRSLLAEPGFILEPDFDALILVFLLDSLDKKGGAALPFVHSIHVVLAMTRPWLQGYCRP